MTKQAVTSEMILISHLEFEPTGVYPKKTRSEAYKQYNKRDERLLKQSMLRKVTHRKKS